MRRIALAFFAVLAMAFGVTASAGAQDIDCPQISYERAQEILAENPSDPYDLDRDNDGEACENNARSGGGAGDNGDDNGDDNDGTTTLPETGTGTTDAAGSAASIFGAVAGLLLIVGAAVRRTAIFRA